MASTVRGNSTGEPGREVSKHLTGMLCRTGLEGIFFFFWNWTEFAPARVWGLPLGTPAPQCVWRRGEGAGGGKQGHWEELRAGHPPEDRRSKAKHGQRVSVQF